MLHDTIDDNQGIRHLDYRRLKGQSNNIRGRKEAIDIVSVYDLFSVTASIMCSCWIDQYSTTLVEEF